MRILSIDIPWGAANLVGIALAEIQGDKIILNAHCINMQINHIQNNRDFINNNNLIQNFIQSGDGLGTILPSDIIGPFKRGLPNIPETRRLYIHQLSDTLQTITQTIPKTKNIDILIIDVPLIPANVATNNQVHAGKTSTFRPLERAFQSKVRIPLERATQNNSTNFAKFQGGIINGCRPGHAISNLCNHLFAPKSILESFPQLVVGSLAEMASELNLELLSGLTSHKRGNQNQLIIGQNRLINLIIQFTGTPINWIENLSPKMRADAIDAILGLLPIISLFGIRPELNLQCTMPIKIINFANPPLTGNLIRPPSISNAIPPYALNSRPWIQENPIIPNGIDDSGIFALDLSLWQ